MHSHENFQHSKLSINSLLEPGLLISMGVAKRGGKAGTDWMGVKALEKPTFKHHQVDRR